MSKSSSIHFHNKNNVNDLQYDLDLVLTYKNIRGESYVIFR